MVYATVTDLESRWRSLSADERARAEVLLGDAAVRIDAQCPPADPLDDEEARKIVSCEMVKRAMGSPADSAVSSALIGAGPYQQQLQYANPTGDLYLTKGDRKLLRCSSQVAFT